MCFHDFDVVLRRNVQLSGRVRVGQGPAHVKVLRYALFVDLTDALGHAAGPAQPLPGTQARSWPDIGGGAHVGRGRRLVNG
jgi:hypothetical protein